MSLAIPKGEFGKFRKLVSLDNDAFGRFLEAVKSSDAAINFRKMADNIGPIQGFDRSDIIDILSLLGPLCGIQSRESLTPGELAKEISETVAEEKAEGFDGRESLLAERIKQLIEIDSVGITAKATDVLTEHQRIFCHARILSDIRPVFSEDLHAAESALIVHTLQIGFYENGEHKEFYVALDTDDIEKLKKIVERAESKTTMLEGVLKKSDLTYLKV